MDRDTAHVNDRFDLYRVLSRDRKSVQRIGARRDDAFHVYYAGTRAFHRVPSVEVDYYLDQEVAYEAITRSEALQAIRAGAGTIEPSKRPELLDKLRADNDSWPLDVVFSEAVDSVEDSSKPGSCGTLNDNGEFQLFRVLDYDREPPGWIGAEVDGSFRVHYHGTQAFHILRAVEDDFFFRQELTYEPITVGEALRDIRAGAGCLDVDRNANLVAELDRDTDRLPLWRFASADMSE